MKAVMTAILYLGLSGAGILEVFGVIDLPARVIAGLLLFAVALLLVLAIYPNAAYKAG